MKLEWKIETDWAEDQPARVFSVYENIYNFIENSDPLFVDEANLNLALRPDSPAYIIPGFQPIPFGQIGPDK